jgi:8-oxo-dGTP diphosphatase
VTVYVAGFLIDPDARNIVLVRKGKPRWQAGRLNGVGGKVEPGEPGELLQEAMRREFHEEAGLNLYGWDWFATVRGYWGSVHFHRLFGRTDFVKTMEAEPIEVHSLDAMPWDECLPNLSWLVPLALYSHDTYAPVVAMEVAYGSR